jgi:acetyl esterase/lipase
LPPLYLSGGAEELMAAEITAYAAKCRAAGVDVRAVSAAHVRWSDAKRMQLTLELVPGLFHTFQLQAVCPEGVRSQVATAAFIRKYACWPAADAVTPAAVAAVAVADGTAAAAAAAAPVVG